MLLLTRFHSDSWLSSSRERNICFLSLFWHFIQSGLSIHSVKIWPALGGREEDGALARVARGLRGSTSSQPLASIECVDVSNFVLLHLLTDQPGLKVSPGHSQEEEAAPGFVCLFCGFGLGFFWSRSCSQPRRAVCCTQGGAGGRKGTATFPAQNDQRLQWREGRWAGTEQVSKDPK